LNSDRKLVTVSEGPINVDHIGIRFNDDVYYFLT